MDDENQPWWAQLLGAFLVGFLYKFGERLADSLFDGETEEAHGSHPPQKHGPATTVITNVICPGAEFTPSSPGEEDEDEETED